MTPFTLLLASASITLLAYGVTLFGHRRHSKRLQALAREWNMHYSPRDQLRMASKVAQAFPIPGVANMRVTDMVYGLVGDSHRFIFTAEYTVGVLRVKKRVVRIASFTERKGDEASGHTPVVQLAPENQPILEQYRMLAPPIEDERRRAAAVK